MVREWQSGRVRSAARGLVIFSGMARGVDTAGHRGAIAGKGKTVAVFGTGVDVPYPKENTRLIDQVLSTGGAVISEFPMATFPAPQNFPIRNRIISGISLGVLVVEAAEDSGTRITARCALEQNREVFAVPGNVTNKNSWGPNTLIKQGAKLVATWEDVWDAHLDVAGVKYDLHITLKLAMFLGPSSMSMLTISPGLYSVRSRSISRRMSVKSSCTFTTLFVRVSKMPLYIAYLSCDDFYMI